MAVRGRPAQGPATPPPAPASIAWRRGRR